MWDSADHPRDANYLKDRCSDENGALEFADLRARIDCLSEVEVQSRMADRKAVNGQYVTEDKTTDPSYLFMADYPRLAYLFYLVP
ncbi:unnamed protein product, partial [Iphiclides podalirius]